MPALGYPYFAYGASSPLLADWKSVPVAAENKFIWAKWVPLLQIIFALGVFSIKYICGFGVRYAQSHHGPGKTCFRQHREKHYTIYKGYSIFCNLLQLLYSSAVCLCYTWNRNTISRLRALFVLNLRLLCLTYISFCV